MNSLTTRVLGGLILQQQLLIDEARQKGQKACQLMVSRMSKGSYRNLARNAFRQPFDCLPEIGWIFDRTPSRRTRRRPDAQMFGVHPGLCWKSRRCSLPDILDNGASRCASRPTPRRTTYKQTALKKRAGLID